VANICYKVVGPARATEASSPTANVQRPNKPAINDRAIRIQYEDECTTGGSGAEVGACGGNLHPQLTLVNQGTFDVHRQLANAQPFLPRL